MSADQLCDVLVLDEAEPDFQIVSIAEQGPAGPRGTSSGPRTLVANVALQAHRLLAHNVLGQVVHADATDPTHFGRVFGMSDSAASAGTEFVVLAGDVVADAGWNFVPSKPVWLDVDGRVTQTPPTPDSAAFCLPVGYAVAANQIFIQIGSPIALH